MYITRVCQKFCNILIYGSLRCVYPATKAVQAIVGTIVVVGMLICCALLHWVYDLKAAQINVHCHLIQKLMLYEFKLITKNIHYAKGKRCSWS